MAMFHDRTTAPKFQGHLLRAAGVPCRVLTTDEVIALTADAPAPPIPFVFRPSPPVDDPRTAVELLEEIRRTIEAQEACHADTPTRELSPEPLLLAIDRTLYNVQGSAILHVDSIHVEVGEIVTVDIIHGDNLADVPHDVARGHMSTTEDTGSADRCSASAVRFTVEQTSELWSEPLLPAVLPSLTSAFSRRRAIFGGYNG